MDTTESEGTVKVDQLDALPTLPIKPSKWACMATAFAIAMEADVDRFIDILGHDGSDILFPELPEPQCRRGHHVQECIDVAYKLGKTVTPIELFPGIKSGDTIVRISYGDDYNGNWQRFKCVIDENCGVIEGQVPGGNYHAVAFKNGVITNPDNGETYRYSEDAVKAHRFFPKCAWIIK